MARSSYLDLSFALSADQPGSGVQQPVAQGFRLGPGEWPVQTQQPQPAQQVAGDGRGQAPGLVERERFRGQMADAGVLAGADAVLHPGVRSMPGLEELGLPGRGAGWGAGWGVGG